MSTIVRPPAQSSHAGLITIDEFEKYEESCGERVELVDGHIVGRSEMGPDHVLAMGLLKEALEPLLPKDRFIREDKPVRIPEFNQPFPDLAVVRGNLRVYATHHPGPEDVSVIIEISDTTLHKDRNEKLPNYARSGIPVYWIVNLPDRQVELYTAPTADRYDSKTVFKAGQSFPVVIDGVEVGQIAVADILPPNPVAGGN
jgi:Uma2 family endonuclease